MAATATLKTGFVARDGRVQSCAEEPLNPLHPRWKYIPRVKLDNVTSKPNWLLARDAGGLQHRMCKVRDAAYLQEFSSAEHTSRQTLLYTSSGKLSLQPQKW
jgi:hypothetical protein